MAIHFVAQLTCVAVAAAASVAGAGDNIEFFEKKVRPVLANRCFECHSAAAKQAEGGLRLDVATGWLAGGDSGKPAVVPGKPESSLMLHAVRHAEGLPAMPPHRPKLSDREISDIETWIRAGAHAPADRAMPITGTQTDWDAIYAARLKWWSLQPLRRVAPPISSEDSWSRNEVDRFIYAKLSKAGLTPAPEASSRVLVRRLSFALTGLPPVQLEVERFAQTADRGAYDRLLSRLLESPHFGERWARHWMDVVHYADTHGYEWDVPAKNAWMYRDYLIRAFNADIPYRQLVLEQLAGDLIEPRIDHSSGLVESLIATMALRLGERRHGDNAAAEGVSQEALANVIDTVGKALLATTVACAQCHDHKLDAIAQQDFFAMAGIFASTRWGVRSAEAFDRNAQIIGQLRRVKSSLQGELAAQWLKASAFDFDRLGVKTKTADHKAKPSSAAKQSSEFPTTLAGWWQQVNSRPINASEFDAERRRRIHHNRAFTMLADFTRREPVAKGWRWDGAGFKHGFAADGDVVVADSGPNVLARIVPAGRWTNLWSERLAGSLTSPLFAHKPAMHLAIGLAAGKHAAQSVVVDNAFHSERMAFLDRPQLQWLRLTIGNFDTLAGGIDASDRDVYVEIATKALNNYFPPRTAYGGLRESDVAEERSWFGVTQVFQGAAGQTPLDELGRFAPLFQDEKLDWPTRFSRLLHAAIMRWSGGVVDAQDALLLNDALQAGLLSNATASSPKLEKLVIEYRALAGQLKPDRTVGAMADWNDGRNARIGNRGSYTDLGAVVERGNIRFLGGPAPRTPSSACGRLELARSMIDANNPLTARVFVNRVWLLLFGEGLVATPDDFGHLGAKPTHPELLDYLAQRFVDDGWSVKKLVALLVGSATWRQSGTVAQMARTRDPENRLWHHMPLRRLDAESVRDAMLSVSGRLDPALYGPPIDPHRAAEDPAKRLACGPVDGNGRRSIYIKMTLMEPSRLLALFNQPIPKLTAGRRDVTNVPNQALALLNDPFVVGMARNWAMRVARDGASGPGERIKRMFESALGRPASARELERLLIFAQRSAAVHGATATALLDCPAVWQDVAHAMFNLKEFIYVP